jgi:RNA polymerase sigma factor (TIGR02999 family)
VLLGQAAAGDAPARDQLFRLVASHLRQRARSALRGQRPDPAVQTTVLIHDTFLELVGDANIQWQDRAQFYRLASRAMRHILIDYARKAKAKKRHDGTGPARLDEMAEPAAPGGLGPLDLLAVDEALNRLGEENPELAEVVQLHHFGGWSLKEIAADVLGISYNQVKTRWQLAQAWLHRALNPEGDSHDR